MVNAGGYVSISVLLLVFSFMPAFAASYDVGKADISLDAGPGSSIRQVIKFYFASPATDNSINYKLSEPAKNIEVYGDGEKLIYNLTVDGNSYNLQIFTVRPVNILSISYQANDIVFHSGDVNYLFTDFSFENNLNLLNAELKLPVGYQIYQNSYKPADGNVVSDGKRIIIVWNETNVNGTVSFSVKYTNPNNDFFLWVIFPGFLITSAVYFYLKLKKKTAEAFLKGFREDEKKTIIYLRGKKTALQSDLQGEFGFSRAKSTRITYELEKKGLVRKQKHGRTNKLFWTGE